MERRPLRTFLARLILLLASAALALAVAEVAVRLFRPQAVMLVDRGLYAPDGPGAYRLAPGFRGRISNRVEFTTAVAINRHGLRGPEVGPKVPGRLRVLVLGDSFAFGVGVEERDSYPRRMEAMLRRQGIDAEVLNAGVPGYGLPEAAAWFERHGRQLAPGVIVVTSFLGNDFHDAAPGQPKAEVIDGVLMIRGERRGSLSRFLYYHSHLFLALKTSSLGAALRQGLKLRAPLEARHTRAELDLYRKGESSALAQEGGAEIEAAFERLRKAAGETPILLVLVPSLLQVDGDQWAGALARAQVDAADYDPRRPIDWFGSSRWSRGAPIADVSPAFARAIERGERIYFALDKHLTPAGYDLLARQVASYVARLVPPAAPRPVSRAPLP